MAIQIKSCKRVQYRDEAGRNTSCILLEFEDGTKGEFKTNRLIVFDAKILHKANINLSNEMRHSIAWKTLI